MTDTRERVHPERLLKQLDALWAEAGKGDGEPNSKGDQGGNGVVRACSLTWITVVEGDERTVDEVDAMLADVMRIHPSRAIVVLLRKGEGRRMKGSVSTQCWRPFGSKQQVCIERILLETNPEGACDLPAVIRALLVADLPVVLFCRNAHLLNIAGIKETSRMADRVVVDIAYHQTECLDLWPSLPKLGRYVSDLAWDRVIPFRIAVGRHFELSAERELLNDLQELRILTRPGRPGPEAAYLMSWLLGSMGYTRQAGAEEGTYTREGHTLRAGFAASPAATLPIHAVEFRGTSQRVRFEVDAQPAQAEANVVLPTAPPPSDTELLSDEMVVEHRRRTFEQFLPETIRLFEEPPHLAAE